MTENNAAQPGLTDEDVEEIRHDWACFFSKSTEGGAPLCIRDIERRVLSKLRAEGVQAGDERETFEEWDRLFTAYCGAAQGVDAGKAANALVAFTRATLASAPVAGEATDREIGALWASTPNPGRVVAFARALLSRYAAPQASEADEEESATDAWRRLALQFDEHRMMAKHHIHMMLANPELHAKAAQEFLAAPPLSGEQVLADRIAAIAKTQADKDGGGCAKGAAAQKQGDSDGDQ